MITGTMNVPMTLEKANYLNALEARDQPRPVEEVKYTLNGEERRYYVCPECGEFVHKDYEFCRKCGQHLDMENIAL